MVPTATGQHCPEGWRFYDLPGPGFKGLPDWSVESSYYTWVDQHNTLGSRRQRADRHGQSVRRRARAGGRRIRHAANSLSDSASTPKASKAASTTRTPAGRAAGCGCPAAIERPGSRRTAKGRDRWSCSFRCVRTRWRIERTGWTNAPGDTRASLDRDQAGRGSGRSASIRNRFQRWPARPKITFTAAVATNTPTAP